RVRERRERDQQRRQSDQEPAGPLHVLSEILRASTEVNGARVCSGSEPGEGVQVLCRSPPLRNLASALANHLTPTCCISSAIRSTYGRAQPSSDGSSS